MEHHQDPGHSHAEARARHLSHAGRCLPRGGGERAGARLPPYRHRRDVRQRGGDWRRASRRPACRGANCMSPPRSGPRISRRTPSAAHSTLSEEAAARPCRSLSRALALAQHEAAGAVLETLMKLKEEGRTRAIGVANFPTALMKVAVEEVKAPIACNQVEYHVMLDQSKLMKYLAAHNDPAGRLLSAGAGPRCRRRAADEDRPQAQCQRRPGRAEMAARPGRRRRDPESLARREPEGQSRRAEGHARRRRSQGNRRAAEGQALRQSGLSGRLGLGERRKRTEKWLPCEEPFSRVGRQ